MSGVKKANEMALDQNYFFLLLSSILVAACGAQNQNPQNYGGVKIDVNTNLYRAYLEDYFQADLSVIDEIEWWVSDDKEKLESFCHDTNIGGCIFGLSYVFLYDDYKDSCIMHVHEMIHAAIYIKTGLVDVEHSHEAFTSGLQSEICSEIFVANGETKILDRNDNRLNEY
ncbi:MAG: hypothetical protein KDD48_01600 [Bdellovibrionales bacterium]|nr:hypothetical protein [Bdellovibrionales bacterium]